MAKKSKRDDELSSKALIRKKLLDIFKDVDKGFTDQRDRSDDIQDYWDIYNCKINEHQFYNGDSQIYLPFVHDAIEARKTRYANQLFPESGRYIDCITEGGDDPHAIMSIAEHYVREMKLKTQIIKPLLVNGDVEGQYTVYCGWKETTRYVTSRKMKGLEIGGLEHKDIEETEDLEEDEEMVEGMPDVYIIPDSDFLVLPVTADSFDDVLEAGGSVSIIRRWSKAMVRKMIDDGDFVKDVGELLIKNMGNPTDSNRPDTKKKLASAAGIKGAGGSKYAQGYETWTKLKVDGKYRVCRAYYGGDQQLLGCKVNPYWCDLIPIISCAVDKMPGVFKGMAPVKHVADVQYFANDTINEGADTAHYSAMPIILTNPEKNPRVGTMITALAAIWETSPDDTKLLEFPDLWRSAIERAQECKQQIFQTLAVDPSMMPQQTGGKQKHNQAEIANEQQVNLLTTADAASVLEEGILTPMVQRIILYDMQFRDEDMLIKKFGDTGYKAMMEEIEPLQMGGKWTCQWRGVESSRSTSMVQQKIAMANVIKGVPPQMYQGFRLDLAPLLQQLAEDTFGPRLGPKTFVSIKDDLTVDPHNENYMLDHGFDLPTHPGDDDQGHIAVHMQSVQEQGDPHGVKRAHIMKHVAQAGMKSQAAAAQGQPQQGAPGGGGPQPGAQPANPRMLKGPPGTVSQDQMGKADPGVAPRRA